MKVCIITAQLPPIRCGVGDHTVQLANTLAARGDEVVVLTGRTQVAEVLDARFTVRNRLPGWGVAGMRQLWREIRHERPDVVLLQWVPFLYSRTGTNIVLPFTLALLSLTGVPMHVMVHEPWVPFTRWSFCLTGPIQRFALATLVTAADRVGVSIERWVGLLRSRIPWKRRAIHWVPVGSNIPVEPRETERLRAALDIPSSAPIVGVFSLFGSAKGYPLISAAWEQLAACTDEPYIVLIGASAEEANVHLPAVASHRRCRTTGYLSSADVSRWLSELSLLVAPFMDGVSSRRGSVMAALAHGVPVVSTRGSHTDSLFLDSPLRLSSTDPDAFAETARALYFDTVNRVALGAASARFYERHFAWSVIADQLLPRTANVQTLERLAVRGPRAGRNLNGRVE